MEDIFKIQYGIETIEHDQREIIEWFVNLEERDKIYKLKVKFNNGQYAALKIIKIERYVENGYIRTEETNYLGGVKKLNVRIYYD